MGEADLIASTPSPRTGESLASDLGRLGVSEAATILVHSSLRSLGWICGGPVAVIQAFFLISRMESASLIGDHFRRETPR